MFARDLSCDFKVKKKPALLKVAIFPLGNKYLEKTFIIGKRLRVYCLPHYVYRVD